MITIKKGLDLPIIGAPSQSIGEVRPVRRVALVGDDYPGMKPTLAVQVGDQVKLGQLLFTDKKRPGVKYTAPGCGKIVAINRGAKRKFESIVIELEGNEEETFKSFDRPALTAVRRDQVVEILINSGMWTALRTRPFSKVPIPDSVPHAIFVTAMDTNPLAANPEMYIKEYESFFVDGLKILTRLTEGRVYVCKQAGASIPGNDVPSVLLEEFTGPHPAGLPGTHIHFLDPVGPNKMVWTINYQDVIAIGKLFLSGRLFVERLISLAGPAVQNPRLVKTRIGAAIEDLVEGELIEDQVRAISGSLLSGRQAAGGYAFLGRFHLQVSVIVEGREREFLGWLGAGSNRFSVIPVYISGFVGNSKKFAFSTSTEGNKRAMVPVGTYEKVMPLDILPTYLLRAIIIGNTEQAQALGCLELDEEDVALCSFVCPGKYNYGPLLRDVLTTIEKEG
jgi:Na+-transporting NADH:ubiquinone oxidoreductase subunit A